MKQVSITDFLTSAEVQKATELYVALKGTGKFAAAVEQEIITPNLSRINESIGQENDSRYLAYAVEYTLDMLLVG